MKILDKIHVKRFRRSAKKDGLDYSIFTDADILDSFEMIRTLKKRGKTDTEIVMLLAKIKSSLEDGRTVLDDIKQNR